MANEYYKQFKSMTRKASAHRRYLEHFNLRNEGKVCGWSAVVEDGRRVYGDTIEDLYQTIHG